MTLPSASRSRACSCATTSAPRRRRRVSEPAPAPALEALFDELAGDGPQVGVVYAAPEAREVMEAALMELADRGISYEVNQLSTLGDPRGVAQYASTAAVRGVRVLIAASSNAEPLAGMIAAYTDLPVIGVPLRS